MVIALFKIDTSQILPFRTTNTTQQPHNTQLTGEGLDGVDEHGSAPLLVLGGQQRLDVRQNKLLRGLLNSEGDGIAQRDGLGELCVRVYVKYDCVVKFLRLRLCHRD